MSRLILISLIIFLTQPSAARQPVYKTWKLFQSDYGYEFKHPDCWDVFIDDAYEEGSLNGVQSIGVKEKTCITARHDPEIPNGIFYVAIIKKYNPKERSDELQRHEKIIQIELKNKNFFVTKRNGVSGDGEMISYVELTSKLKNTIRWRGELFCPNRRVSISGPSMKDPSDELLKKFKSGDLALPEPYKTILGSVGCIKDRK